MPDSLPFNLPFTEASKYFAKLVPVLGDEHDALPRWAKTRAFTAATITKAEILQAIFKAQQSAIDEGLTQAQFNAKFDGIMSELGWTGTTPWHAENILRTNAQQAYGSGKLDQAKAQRDDFPYWLFVAVLDDRTSEECEELNGTVFPIDDTAWWPPIHFECRSGTESLTQEEAEELGIESDPDLPDSTGFDGPGSSAGDEYDPDLSNLDDALAEIVRDTLDGFNADDVED